MSGENSYSRRSVLATVGGLTTTLVGCTANHQTMQQQKQSDDKFPPNVPTKPESSISQWDVGNYNWMIAAHVQDMNKKIERQNELLVEIRDELRSLDASDRSTTQEDTS